MRAVARDERGASLVELVVTMAIATVVLIAIFSGIDAFTKAAKTADNEARAQDDARRTIDQIVHQLRQARVAAGQTSPIPTGWTISRSDLVVATYVTSATNATPGSTKGWVRYCTSTVGTSVSLIAGVRAGDTYAAPGACAAGDTTNGWTQIKLINGTLQGASTLFDYQSTTCIGSSCTPAAADVRTVGINLAVGTAAGAGPAHRSLVRDAVSFRNRA